MFNVDLVVSKDNEFLKNILVVMIIIIFERIFNRDSTGMCLPSCSNYDL